MCQICFDSENTLAVHHKRYLNDVEPWDYPSELLITLCEECHAKEREIRPDNENDLLSILKENFFSDDIHELAVGFNQLQLKHTHEVVASVYSWALSDPDIQRELVDRYFKMLIEKGRKDNAKG